MPPIAVAPLLAGALLFPLAAPSVAGPAGTGPVGTGPVGWTISSLTAGLAFGDFTYPVNAGKEITVERHVLDPGEVIRWNGPGTTVAINQSGNLTNFPSCSSKQQWRAFPAYYVVRSQALGTLRGVTANLSEDQIELITITSGATGLPQRTDQLHRHSGNEIPEIGDVGETANEGGIVDPVEPAAACPSGPAGSTTRLASGTAASDEQIDLLDHNQIVVYRHTMPAGFNSGWFASFDPTVIVPVAGQMEWSQGCDDAVPRPVGTAFYPEGPHLARNVGSGPAEYLSLVWNVQNGAPVDVPVLIPELPPTECPDSILR